MSTLADVVEQLKKEHSRAVNEVKRIGAALAAFGATYRNGVRLSAAAKAKISEAQKARWAKVRKDGGQKQGTMKSPRKRTMSTAARQKIAAAQRARWAKVKSSAKKSA